MSDVARATSYLDQASEQQVIVAAARPTLLRRLGDLNCAVDGCRFEFGLMSARLAMRPVRTWGSAI